MIINKVSSLSILYIFLTCTLNQGTRCLNNHRSMFSPQNGIVHGCGRRGHVCNDVSVSLVWPFWKQYAKYSQALSTYLHLVLILLHSPRATLPTIKQPALTERILSQQEYLECTFFFHLVEVFVHSSRLDCNIFPQRILRCHGTLGDFLQSVFICCVCDDLRLYRLVRICVGFCSSFSG